MSGSWGVLQNRRSKNTGTQFPENYETGRQSGEEAI